MALTGHSYTYTFRVSRYENGREHGIAQLFPSENEAREFADEMAVVAVFDPNAGGMVNQRLPITLIDWREEVPSDATGVVVEQICVRDAVGTEATRVRQRPPMAKGSFIG